MYNSIQTSVDNTSYILLNGSCTQNAFSLLRSDIVITKYVSNVIYHLPYIEQAHEVEFAYNLQLQLSVKKQQQRR